MLNVTGKTEICKPDPHLLIIGASTRAAAVSAVPAGLQPTCVDLFADSDLAGLCPVVRLPAKDFPAGFQRAAQLAPPGPFIYVGGLENHPEIVASISRSRALW